jgi:hypothetical protein
MQAHKTYGVFAFAAGAVLLFAGSALANVGQSVDNLIASKWTAIALMVFGAVLFVGVGSSFSFSKEL